MFTLKIKITSIGVSQRGGGVPSREGKGSLYGLKQNPSHPQGAREREGPSVVPVDDYN